MLPSERKNDLEQKMSRLRSRYLEGMLRRIDDLAIFQYRLSAGELKPEDILHVKHVAHNLAGTAGTFGFHEVTGSAHLLGDLLRRYPTDVSAVLANTLELIRECEAAVETNAELLSESALGHVAYPLILRDAVKPSVLLVDDDVHIQELLVTLLHGIATVTVKTNCIDALNEMKINKPALVLLDDSLPGSMGGVDMLEYRALVNGIDAVPTYMLTANAAQESINRALAAGAIGYITKPFDPVRLVELLVKHLGH